MKTLTFTLTATFEIDPQGETADTLKHQITSAMKHAIGNGLITGETAATCEHSQFEVKLKEKKKITPKKVYTRKTGYHLFNEETGCCFTCGIAAEDDAITNEKCTFKRKK